jgi:predicted dinucleotide-binding enzyme
MQIAILGAGHVGGALGKNWARAGHRIAYGTRTLDDDARAVAAAAGGASLGSVAQAVEGADAIVLAVPFGAVGAVLAAAGDLTGRIVIDATNPVRMGAAGLELALGLTISGGEQVAALAPGAAVFKTLNQIGFEAMADPSGFPVPPAMFVAGDDAARKPAVMQLVGDLGFAPIDAGPLSATRLLEPLAMLWIHMALTMKTGRNRGFAFVARG